ncbi:MAG: nucleotide exchange factor GrpE [Candidatus Shapirobacteria bacterium]|jgi:molecular chaperone GrpE
MVKKYPKNNNNQVEKLVILEQKNIELEDRLKRSLADYANFERRIESQRQLFITLTTTAIVTKMIEILDDLYLTYKHLQDSGLKMTIDKFTSVLKSEGLEEILAKNQEFDPQFMECIEVVEGKNNFVIDVKKIGYKLNGHVIRPAQVTVGKTDQIIN